MKAKIFITAMLAAGGLSLYSQPVGTSPVLGGTVNKNFWSRQGNTLTLGGINNIFGFRAGSNSQVWFQTNGRNRMMINKGFGASTDGFIGMGNNLPGAFVAQARLHLHQTTNNTSILFTNGTTTPAAGRGFEIGNDALGAAYIKQQENLEMTFWTNNLERMRLSDVGNLMLGTITPMRFVSGGTQLAKYTIDAGTGNFVMGTTSSGLIPRIYFQTTNTAVTNQFVGHSVPDVGSGDVRSTSGILWNNIDFVNYRSDFHVSTRTSVPLGTVSNTALTITNKAGQVGIRNNTPANRLEITSLPGTDPQPAGLRFTNLPSTSATVVNPGVGVLAVNGQGDVIYVSAPAGGIGSYCTAAPNPLTGNYNIPTNNFNIYYPGQGVATTNAIGLGYNCSAPMPAKLNVLQQNSSPVPVNTLAGSFINNDVAGTPSSFITGITATSTAIQTSNNITNTAGLFIAGNSPSNNYAVAARTTSSAGGINMAGNFSALSTNPGTNYGVFAIANNATTNYAVYGSSTASGGITGPNYAGFFNGDLVYTGSFGFSDSRLKKDVKQIGNSMNILSQLNPVTYLYKTDEYKNISLSKAKQYGFIAQEVQKILPELTTPIVVPAVYDSLGKEITAKQEFTGLNYIGFIAILTDALKEQQKEIDQLKDMVKGTASTSTDDRAISNITLNDQQSVILEQNVPNPFAEQTIITYNLPEATQKAQLLFYNNEGRLINSIELVNKSGKGQVNVFANDLSNGIYTYTLVVDGKIMGTKKMIKSK